MANVRNISLGRSYLKRMYDALDNRSFSYETFLNALRLNSYSELLSEEDFNDWLDSLGYRVATSQTMWTKPHELLIEKMVENYSDRPSWTPTRKSIDSFFINPDNYSPKYFDVLKMGAMETMKVVTATGELVGAAGSVLTNSLHGLKYVAFIAVPVLIGYYLYANRDSIGDDMRDNYKKLKEKLR